MTSHTLDQANEFADTAFAMLKRNAIPPYPVFFELFYTYASGAVGELNARMDALLQEGPISSDAASRLCIEFLNISDMDNRLRTMSRAVTRNISDVNHAIDLALANANAYSGSLLEANGDLSRGINSMALQALSARLLDETRRMQQVNHQLESQLEDSREYMAALQRDLEDIRREALLDPLTGIPNRKCFEQRLLEAMDGAAETGSALSLIVFDIDCFKAFNDTYGHLTGDQVLRLVAQVLKASVRGRDLPARFGGEEFVAVLPDTDLDGAIAVAENIRRSIQAKELLKRSTNEKLGRITLSAGVAQYRTIDTPASFIERADHALYLAKETGRNRVASERKLAPVTPA